MSETTLPDVHVGVAILITRAERVLLIRRKYVHGGGTWSTPGGHLDHGESIEACAARETLEETGLIVKHIHFLALTNDVFPEVDRHYITVWMRGSADEGEAFLAAPYESDAIGWYAWDALPEPLFSPFQHLINGECLPSGALTAR
jgi:8-oxo-dGTP diphosphatase